MVTFVEKRQNSQLKIIFSGAEITFVEGYIIVHQYADDNIHNNNHTYIC